MSSPFFFPSGEESYSVPRREDPQSQFFNLYQQYQNRVPPIETQSYLNPEDPEILNLRNMYANPTGSTELVNSYLDRRPEREDYSPGLGRKLAAFALGALSGGGYNAARAHIEAPYQNAYKDWTDEGKFINDQVRLLEADRAREIKATEFGLKAKNEAARRNALSEESRRRLSSNLAGQESRDVDRDADRELREKRAIDAETRAKGYLDLARERQELARERYEHPIKIEDPKEVLENTEAAKKLAFERARGQSLFKPLFDYYDEQVSGGNKQPDFRAYVSEHPEYSDTLKAFRQFMEDYSTKVMSQGRK